MFHSSIVSYGENGRDKRYGSSSYRGNTDGGIVKDFLDFCEMKLKKVDSCSDYMSGSYTTRDVCLERGINGVWTDLSNGFNMLLDSCPIPDRPQTIFWHPPYSSLIGIPYAGKEWNDKEFIQKYGYDPKPYDLGRMDWDQFVKAMNYCCLKMYAAMETGGRMGILMGDIRKSGVYKSMLLDIAKPGEIESIVIKKQVHTSSGYKDYGKTLSFIPIEQEYFLILKKVLPYMLDFTYTKKCAFDIRDSKTATWKDVILSVMESLNKNTITSQDIEKEISGFKKCENNHNVNAKIRQTLQQLCKCGLVIHKNENQWCLA